MVELFFFRANDLFVLVYLVSKVCDCLVFDLKGLLVLLRVLFQLLVFLFQNGNLVIQVLSLALARLQA